MTTRFPLSLVLFSVAPVLSTFGCRTVAEYNAESMAEIRPRAAFELRCKPEELKFTPLVDRSPHYKDGIVVQYGVDGCGGQLVYVYTPSGWVANSATSQK